MNKIIDVAEKIDNPSALTQDQGDIIFNAIIPFFEKNGIWRSNFYYIGDIS